jgi:hypothetical protein
MWQIHILHSEFALVIVVTEPIDIPSTMGHSNDFEDHFILCRFMYI